MQSRSCRLWPTNNDRLGSNGQEHPAQRPSNAFLSFAMSNFTCFSISAATPTGLRLVWIAHHIDEHRGHDLPPHAVLIDDPAA
jgi:hypothetical protein